MTEEKPFPSDPTQWESWSDYVCSGPTDWNLIQREQDQEEEQDCVTLQEIEQLIKKVYQKKDTASLDEKIRRLMQEISQDIKKLISMIEERQKSNQE